MPKSSSTVTWKELFDFSKIAEVKEAIKTIEKLDTAYTKVVNNAKKKKAAYSKAISNIKTSTNELAGAIGKVNLQTSEGQTKMSGYNTQLKKMADTTASLKGKTVELEGTTNQLTEEQKKFNKQAKETIRLDKQLAELKRKETSLNSKQAKEIALVRERIMEKNRAMKKSAQETLGLVTLYQKESQRLIQLRKNYKEVALELGVNSRQAKKLSKELTVLDRKLKQVDAGAGQFQRNVGGYRQALTAFTGGFMKLAGALGFVGGIYALISAFKSAISTIMEFEDGAADLAGVLGKSVDEISPLTNEALRLGATTAKTTQEVLQLEVAYSRLGFTQSEILNLTEDTINGSIALNAELAETAELTGAMVRTFDDLKTTDADVILDQMTAATQKSALNFEKLSTALPIAGAAANASGVKFTTLLSLMGKLSDAGLDTSTAATSLRNIFIESGEAGVDYTELLDKVRNSTDRLKTANELFGKRGAVAAVILSQQTEEAKALDLALQDVGGTAERVAAQKLDTLTGATQLLTSAWEGFILSIDKGDGALSRFIRGSLSMLTSLLGDVTLETQNQIGVVEQQRVKFISLTNSLIHLNLQEEEAKTIINELNTEYSEYLPNLISEKTTKDELLAIQRSVNDELIMTILLKEREVELNKVADAQVGFQRQINDKVKEQGALISENAKLVKEHDDLAAKGMFKAAADKSAQIMFNEDLIAQKQVEIDQMIRLRDEGTSVIATITAEYEKLAEQLGIVTDRRKEDLEQRLIELEKEEEARSATDDWIDKETAALERQMDYEDLLTEKIAKNLKIRENLEKRHAQMKLQMAMQGAALIAGMFGEAAIAQKALALFNIFLSTKAGMAAAIAPPPLGLGPVAGIPLSTATAAFGGVQAAAVIATAIPQFKDGGVMENTGLAMVGEVGPELMVNPRGELSVIGSQGAELRDIEGGSEIFTNAIFNKLMAGGSVGKNNEVKADIGSVLRQEKIDHHAPTRATMKNETDAMLKGMQGIMKGIPMTVWSSRPDRMIRDVIEGDTTYIDVEDENSF